MHNTLANGVNLHVISTEKYKTVRMMIRFSAPLEKNQISKRTLLSSLLETNSKHYPTQTKLSEKLADLYGASFGVNINKKGNSHYVTVILNVVNDKFLPTKELVLPDAVEFIKEILFFPNMTEDGFDQETFDREKYNLKKYIDSVNDDKQSQASLALQELYFSESEDQKTPSFGTVEAVEKLTSKEVMVAYNQMIDDDQVDIIIIGDVDEESMFSLFKEIPFKDRVLNTNQDFYTQPITELKTKTEKLPVLQSKLNLAYQTGIYFHEDNYFPLQVFNGIFGGFPHSKLFMNVREKESMAYYASSGLDTFRGLLTVQTGIDGTNKDRVLDLVSEQLKKIKDGEVSEEELHQTKEMLKNSYLLTLDNPAALIETRYLEMNFEKSRLSAEEWLDGVAQVTVADIQEVASLLTLQAVYFMQGGKD